MPSNFQEEADADGKVGPAEFFLNYTQSIVAFAKNIRRGSEAVGLVPSELDIFS